MVLLPLHIYTQESSPSEDGDDDSVKEQPLFSTPADILARLYGAGGGVLDEEGGGAHSVDSEGEEKGVRWDPQLLYCEETTETRGGTLETADSAKRSGRKVTPTTADSSRGSGRKATPTSTLVGNSHSEVLR